MDFWIMSQDKTQIVIANNISCGKLLEAEGGKWAVMVNSSVFGYYKDEESAKNVVYEISREIYYLRRCYSTLENAYCFYEMPQENEV